MLVVPDQQYPLICVAVSKGMELSQVVRFGTVNPNSTSSWFTEAGQWHVVATMMMMMMMRIIFIWTLIVLDDEMFFCPLRYAPDLCHPRHPVGEGHHISLSRQ